MKKILNDPFAYVDEMLEGLCLAHPEYYRRLGRLHDVDASRSVEEVSRHVLDVVRTAR